MAVLAAVVRGLRAPLARRARQLLARPLPLARLHPAAARARPGGDPDLAGRRRRPSTATRPRRRSRARSRRSRAARSPRRSRSSSSGTNGGGFYNSNSAVPFENPNGLTNFLEMLAILLIPAAQVFMFGRMVAARAGTPGWCSRPCSRCSRSASASRCPAEQHGSQVLRDSGVNITAGQRPVGRQHGRQGGPLRDRQHRALGDRDDRRLERLGQRRPRRADRRRRRRADREHVHRRGDLRRRRLGPVRDVLLHPDRRLRRRADGRANARVARQEDRGARDQARRARRAVRADDGARR